MAVMHEFLQRTGWQMVFCLWMVALPITSTWAQAGTTCQPQGSTEERNACVIQHYQAADTSLSIRYGQIMDALPAQQRPALRKEQQAWLRQRATHCHRVTAEQQSQSDWPTLYHQCLMVQIQLRHTQLQQWQPSAGAALPP